MNRRFCMNEKIWSRMDYKMVGIILFILCSSLFTIAATNFQSSERFFSPLVLTQSKAVILGIGIYLLCAKINYGILREYSPLIYLLMLVALIGLFFVPTIQNVHRWYRFPFLPFAIQPSEYAKLGMVLTTSWYLEKQKDRIKSVSTFLGAFGLLVLPFILIYKQPDLGTALVLLPIFVTQCYFAGIHPKILKAMTICGACGLVFVVSIFLGIFPFDEVKPVLLNVLKEYQVERLNPHTYHQISSQTSIALGGWFGSGWGQSSYMGQQWLPFAHTDSVFCAFAEEWGVVGGALLMGAYFALFYCGFKVTNASRDLYGKLVSSGITIYLFMHFLINIGMMLGMLPITGVPLPLMSYGGSSLVATLAALGILQSIHLRRFMF